MSETLWKTAEKNQDVAALREYLGNKLAEEQAWIEAEDMSAKPTDTGEGEFLELWKIRTENLQITRMLLENYGHEPVIWELSKVLLEMFHEMDRLRREVGNGLDTPQQREALSIAGKNIKELRFSLSRFFNKDKRTTLKNAEIFIETYREKIKLQSEKEQMENRLSQQLHAEHRWFLKNLALQNSPQALTETLQYSQAVYLKTLKSILELPKRERDVRITQLLKTLQFYQGLQNKEYLRQASEGMDEQIRKILANQDQQFTGFRGMIQQGIAKGINFLESNTPTLLNMDEQSVQFLILKAAYKLGRDLSKPVTYDPELLQATKGELISQLEDFHAGIDFENVEALLGASLELQATPDQFLPKGSKAEYTELYTRFLENYTDFQAKTLQQYQSLTMQAYRLTRGEDNSSFADFDTQREARLSWEGKNILRTLAYYSPFGVFLPEKIQLKTLQERMEDFAENLTSAERKEWDKLPDEAGRKKYMLSKGMPISDEIYLQSVYEEIYNEHNPLVSGLVQSGEFALLWETGIALMKGGYSLWRKAAIKPTLGLAKFLPKKMPKFLSKGMRRAWQVWLGYEVGEMARDYRTSKHDQEFLDLVKNYDTIDHLPEKQKQKLRSLTLRNELDKRREAFQSVGVDLSQFDLELWDQIMLGSGSERDLNPFVWSMQAEGTLREALLATNRKLVLFGLEWYELPEDS